MRWRPALSMGVIVALVVGVWAALSSGNDSPPETTTSTAAPTSTTTSTTAPTTTSTMAPTTTSSPATTATTTDAEARLEEVRLILEDLYFRWFDAIYNNDEEAVLQVIATENNLLDFHNAVEAMDLTSPPSRSDVRITDVDVLHDERDCLVAYSVLDVSAWRGEGAITQGVDVLLPIHGTWRFATAWENKNDLWQADCQIEPDFS